MKKPGKNQLSRRRKNRKRVGGSKKTVVLAPHSKRFSDALLNLAIANEKQLEFWKAFQSYLADEREKRRDAIRNALIAATTKDFKSDQFVRIVDSRFQTRPLCSYGSVVVPPGGRFNIGEISISIQRFQALYVASDYPTAFAERFLRDNNEPDSNGLTAQDLRLDPNASFSVNRIGISLERVLDLRNAKCLKGFLEVISDIEPNDTLIGLAKYLRQPHPKTVKDLDTLMKLILDPNFTQWGSLLDQASHSQWLGLYARDAGINGIIYPSVRGTGGANIAIFLDTFESSSCHIKLLDTVAGVAAEEKYADQKNYWIHMQSAEMRSLGGQIQ